MTNLQDTFSQISCNEFILRTLDILIVDFGILANLNSLLRSFLNLLRRHAREFVGVQPPCWLPVWYCVKSTLQHWTL